MYKLLYLVFPVVFFAASCVLPSKHQRVVDEKNKLARENQSLFYLKEQNQKDRKELEELKQKLTMTEELLFETNSKLTASTNLYEKCQAEYDKMLIENQKLLERAFMERSNLTEELAQKQKLLADKEKTLRSLETDINNRKLAQDLLQNDLNLRQQKIDSLNNMLSVADKRLHDIRNKISSLLTGYSNDDISIEQRSDGKLYITMSQELLFQTGSDKIDSRGRAIIGQIADAIKTETGFSILVEGHTDTDGSSARNWDLSVQRAVAVVKILEAYGVMSQRITAAGRGQYMPLLPNTSAQNKAKNRRTEIILEPNLSEIMRFLQ
jgi:chemotaxis protein MotB